MFSVLILCGCAQSAHQTGRDVFDRTVPKALRHEIDWNVAYSDLQAAPDQFVGRTVALGGVVLQTKRTKAGTEMEVLQVPLNGGMSPAGERNASQGRFLAIAPDGPDPASIQNGTPVTVVGVVEPPQTRPLDETEYTYPVVQVRSLIPWTGPDQRSYAYGPYYDYPYYGYYGAGFYGGGLYRPYWWGGPYGSPWVPYYFYGPGIAPPVAPPPPPARVPPQFRKRD